MFKKKELKVIAAVRRVIFAARELTEAERALNRKKPRKKAKRRRGAAADDH